MVKHVKNLTTDTLHLFWTDGFSQWAPVGFTADDGTAYICAEQYMMHQKALLFGDTKTAEKIMQTTSPRDHKNLGRAVSNFDDTVWQAHMQDIVYRANYYKFTQNPDLWDALQKTKGREIVEASPYDTIWGIGLYADDPDAQDKSKWRGQNLLGALLTQLRDDLLAAGFSPATPKKHAPPRHKPFTP